jgi:hypothetical protein
MSKLESSDSMTDFADHQKIIIREKKASSDADLDDAILKCYKFAYYPAVGNRLAYATMDWRKGGGQRFLVDELRNKQKIRTSGDMPDNPESLVDSIVKFKKDAEITTLDFRNEFYKDTALPMLIGDGVFSAGVLLGIKQGVFVYKRGELVCGKGDPSCEIVIDGDSVVYTAKRARKLGVWPRKPRNEEVVGPDEDTKGSDSKKGTHDAPSAFDLSLVQTTGEPSQAVRNVLDELRKHKIGRISKMRIESRNDVFPLLTTIGRIRDFEARVEIEGDYSIDVDSVFHFDFVGTLKNSEPVQEFLKPQLRDASVPNIRVVLDMDFKDGIGVDWLETLADRLRLAKNDVTVSDIAGAPE